MRTTVHFATNRPVVGDGTEVSDYGSGIVSPSDPGRVTYATAFVDGTDIAADRSGRVVQIGEVNRGGCSDAAIGDLSTPGRNILVFLHGFDNTFEDALTRGAYNRDWIAASGASGADTSIVAFSWPSAGRLIDWPFPPSDYQRDQTIASQSGVHIMDFLSRLLPLLTAARRGGARCHLLCHSVGNFALQAAVESWFAHGNGAAEMFDEVILAAADERYDSFGFPLPGRLSGLSSLARHVSVYFSQADAVLALSSVINGGVRRLGERGPEDMTDPTRFSSNRFRFVGSSRFRDYDFNFITLHQYYRSSPAARADIASVL